MTIKQRQCFRNVSQKKKIVVFECQKERLCEAAPEEQLEQGGWRMKQWHAIVHANSSQTAELSPQGCERRKIEDGRVCPCEERLLVEGELTERDNYRLLILANSAELMSESEDNLRTVHINPIDHEVLDSTTGAQHLQENANDVMATDNDNNCDKVDEKPPIAHERIKERDGSHGEGTVTRLSQIRRLARLRSQSLMQKSIQEDTYSCLQRSKTRLTQILRQARSGNHVPMQKDITGITHGKLLGGITRLSQIRRQARSGNNCSLQEGTQDHINSQLDCQFHEDHQKEDKAAEQMIGATSSSRSVDAENMDNIMYEKGRLCLSQLTRKVCLGNAELVARRNAGIV